MKQIPLWNLHVDVPFTGHLRVDCSVGMLIATQTVSESAVPARATINTVPAARRRRNPQPSIGKLSVLFANKSSEWPTALGNSAGNEFAVHFLAHKQIHTSLPRPLHILMCIECPLSPSPRLSTPHCPRPTLAPGLLYSLTLFISLTCSSPTAAFLLLSFFLSIVSVFSFHLLQTSKQTSS